MIHNKSVFHLIALLFSVLILGCKSKEIGNSNLKRNVAAFVSDSNRVVGFGYVDIENVKDKSGIGGITELKKFLENTLRPVEAAVRLEDKIFYAFAGPVQDNGPEVRYAFLNIKDKDSLQDGLELMGYYFKESDILPGVKFYDDESTAIGFNDHTLILVFANFDHDPKKLILDAFQSFEQSKINKDVLSVLSSQKDVVLATYIDGLYNQSPFLKRAIPKENQANFEKLLQGGIWTLGVQFNKGNLIAELDISDVNERLKQLYFLQRDNHEISKNLGADTANFALLLHLDMERLDTVMHYLGEQQIKNLYKSLYLPVMVKALIASEGLSGLTNGSLGFVVGDKMNKEALLGLGMYNMNFDIGLGENSQNIIDLIDTLAGAEQISDLGDGFYQVQDEGILQLKNNNLLYHSNTSNKDDFNSGTIKIKHKDPHFGALPVSVYMNLDDKHYTFSHLPKNVSHLLDYTVLQGNNNAITLKIVMKENSTNVLKQLLDAYKKEIISRVKNTPMYE